MKKLLTFLTLLTLSIGVTWAETTVLTGATTGVTGTNYTDWTKTVNDVTFKGNSASNNDGDYIQLRSKNSNSGIVSTNSIGTIKKIIVSWNTSQDNSNKTLDIYGKNSAYSAPSELYNSSNQGTKLGSIVYGESTELTVSGSYAYIGLRSRSGAIYIDQIVITWETGGGTVETYAITCNGDEHGSISATPNPAAENETVTITSNPQDGYQLGTLTAYKTGDTSTPVSISNNQFTMPGYPVTVDATFAAKPTHSITVNGGTASLPTAYEGQSVTVTPTIPEGKVVDQITTVPSSLTLTASGDGYTFTMPGEAVSISFTFKDDPAANAATATFDATVDKGTSPLSKGPVTFACSNGILNNGTEYRLYANSTTTFSVPEGYKIVKIEFTGTDTDKPLTGLSTTTGNYTATQLSGTWIGEAESVTFTASAQSRATLIKVYYTAPDVTSNIYRVIKTNGETSTAGGWLGNWSENCTLPDGATGTDYVVTADAGETIQFKAGTNDGYQILAANVSAVDADDNEVALTTVTTEGSGITFSFTMPASAVTITANFTTYRGTIRLAGRFNGNTGWRTGTSGPAFTYDGTNDKYTIDAYFTGEGEGNYFFITYDGNASYPSANGNWSVTNTTGTPTELSWDGEGHNFAIDNGVYTIELAGDLSTIAFAKQNPTFTFSPAAGEIATGTSVSATSTLTSLVSAIKANDSGASGDVTVQVSTGGSTYSDNVTLTADATVTAKATIGNYSETATASYTVVSSGASGDYEKVTSTDNLEDGEYLIVYEDGSLAFNGGLTTLDGTGNFISVTIANDKIVATETVDAAAFTITTTNGTSTIQSASGKYIGRTATSNGFNESTTEAYTNTITFDTDGNAIITSSGGPTLQYFSSGNNSRFRYYASSQKAIQLYKKASSNKSAVPVITPASGNIVGFSQEVEITQANGGTIYCTTDGTTPDATLTPYSGKFWVEAANLGDEITVTAVAKEEGKELSNPVSVTYKFIAPAAPTFSPQGGTYTSYQYVELASATEGADVYYTTDGSNPSVNNGTKYTEPIAVTENVTIKAITVYHDAHVNKDATSGSRQAKYTIVTDGIVEVENIAEFNAIQPDENNEYPEVRFKNPVTVLYDYSQRSYSSQLQLTTYQEYIWVKDESGFTQIFLRPSLNSNNNEDHQIAFYENGDVIPGGFVVRKQYYETGEYYQAYSDKAGTDPTLPGSNVTAGFAEATQKALADPEPMTAAQLADLTPSDENIANYNNRYIRISKIKVTYIDGKNFDFEDENGNGSNIAGYNKYSDATSYMKGGETLVTETINFPQTASNTTYYDVTAILCTWQNGWEIMPIKFEPYVEKTVTLRELCDKGVTTPGQNEYTISNNLMCVFAKGNSIWVKDDTGQSIWMAYPADGDLNFNVYTEAAEGIPANTRLNQAYYDQSNWCEIKLADGVDASQFEGQIIKGGTIHGEYTDKLNPTLENVTLTSAAISSEGSYAPNYYMPANFFGPQECYNPNHSTDYGQNYFFMTPKPQEYAQIVWAVWNASTTSMIMSTDDNRNGHRFAGEFEIDLSMNTGASSYTEIQNGATYNFTAIIRKVSGSDSKAAGDSYKVYPLDLNGQNPATGINTVDVTGKAVKSVKYVNVAGMVSDVPFQGVNIVVTEYTDGSRTTSKMLRK